MAATEGQIRILIQDAKGPKQYLPTEHYTAILQLEPDNVYRAAAIACRAIASKFAIQVNTTADKVSISRQQKFEHFMKLADKFDAMADKGSSTIASVGGPALTGVSNDEIDSQRQDTDRPQSKFRKGMDDNPPDGGDENFDCCQ